MGDGKLDYLGRLGIPVDGLYTRSLRMGGSNTLALAGYNHVATLRSKKWGGGEGQHSNNTPRRNWHTIQKE